MKRRTLTLGLISILCASCMTQEEPSAQTQSTTVNVSMEDFKTLEGDTWNGALAYLNYNSDERSTIPVKLAIKVLSDQKLQYAIQYPGEESHNAKEVLRLSKDGAKIDGAVLVSRETDIDGALVLTTEAKGKDDNRPANIQMVYIVAPNVFSIRKNVKFASDATYFNRNEYRFTR